MVAAVALNLILTLRLRFHVHVLAFISDLRQKVFTASGAVLRGVHGLLVIGVVFQVFNFVEGLIDSRIRCFIVKLAFAFVKQVFLGAAHPIGLLLLLVLPRPVIADLVLVGLNHVILLRKAAHQLLLPRYDLALV